MDSFLQGAGWSTRQCIEFTWPRCTRKAVPDFYRGDSQMAAAAKAFDGAVRGDGRQRRRTEGRKGRANSGNPIASSPREGRRRNGRKEAASMTDGRTISSANAFRNWRPRPSVSRARTNGSLSVSVVAIRGGGGDRRTDRPRSLADFDADEEIK